MAELFNKVKQEIEKGISTVSLKSKEVLESMKIKKQMETLQEQIHITTCELGQIVYAGFSQNNPDQVPITEKCTAISALCTELKEKEAKLNLLRLETGEALGKTYCGKCKTEIAEGSQFCGQCGEKIPMD